MLTLRCITKTRASLPPLPTSFILNDTITLFFVSSSSHVCPSYYYNSSPYSNSMATAATAASTTVTVRRGDDFQLQAKDVVLSFKDWFKSRNNQLFDRIFEILGGDGGSGQESGGLRQSADLALTQLGLRLSEAFVLDVLDYGKSRNNVLSCLKFFDWAGRPPGGFHHTRATFHAILKILSKAKLMSLMLDFLDTYTKQRSFGKASFYNTLVMGYAVAGKPEVALQVFGKMRFQGIDLDAFAYHILLNALVEESYFDAVDVVFKQIALRGFESEVTYSILVKKFIKQNQLDKAESSIRRLLSEGRRLNGYCVRPLVDALCKRNQFEKAGELLNEFHQLGMVCLDHAYGIWIKDLGQAGKLDGALEFLKSKNKLEGYVPDLFRYNHLIYRLLRESRLEDVCDLLIEMKERKILPDEVTMNAALCFFCKAGMVDVALELYKLRNEFGLSPSGMAYNYLINTLCGDGSIDEAYHVLKDSVDQGYFLGKKTFSILADALCREGKFDKMMELVVVALGRNLMPSDSTYDKFISALCKSKKVEDGYLIHGALNRLNKVSSKITYFNLIHGFIKSNRGDFAARLLIEMQEKGHSPTRKLYRAVICCLCDMENPEKQFVKLLEMQLSRLEPKRQVYSFFIDGAGHARKPELAREVFEMMVRSGIEPNLRCDILMLQSYLKNDKISDALSFFRVLSNRRRIGKKLRNTIIVGLCKANKPDLALEMLGKMTENKVKPSMECYEELVKVLCVNNKYSTVVNLLDDLIKIGRPISSFIGNVLLFQSLNSQDFYWAWVHSRDVQNGASSNWLLSQLICAFSSRQMDQDVEDLEELIEQCFPLNLYTYNMLLRRLSMGNMDHAIELFNRLCHKGYKPNRWTYDILAHGFFKHGMTVEAKRWVEEMYRKGFDPTASTKEFI